MTESAKTVVQKHAFNTLANKITILRIVAIPALVIGLFERQREWVIGILAFSMITDLLDGLAARLRGERTKLGAFLDPMADKLLLTAAFMSLTVLGDFDVWVFVVIFSRDLLIVLGWIVIYILTGASHITPRPLGKTTTAVQMTTALAVILGFGDPIKSGLIWAAVVFTVISAIDYIIVGERRLGEWA